MKGYGKGMKMPNEGGKNSSMKGGMGSNTGKSTGLKVSNEMRSDTTKTPTTTNRYPNGMA